MSVISTRLFCLNALTNYNKNIFLLLLLSSLLLLYYSLEKWHLLLKKSAKIFKPCRTIEQYLYYYVCFSSIKSVDLHLILYIRLILIH